LDPFQVSRLSNLRIEEDPTMTQPTSQTKLIAVKQALADKYRSLAEVAKSDMKRFHFSQKAKRYQSQASRLA